MSITQYSRIQHRRGLLADLPAVLNTSELGHAVDVQRLFIGNGQLADGSPTVGNTEIITNYTLLTNPTALEWIYRSNTPVVAQTGLTAQTPVVRSVGEKLDDMVNVRDYGAKGDGVTDDTNAINKALRNLYTVAMPGPYAAQMAYRKLYFPAGVYLISNYIFLPPYATLVGEGLFNTIIKNGNNSNLTSVVRTADSLFQNALSTDPFTSQPAPYIGSGGATLPTHISAEGITFINAYDAPVSGTLQSVINLEVATNVLFRDCGLVGAWAGATSGSESVHLDNLGLSHTQYTPSNIKFIRTQFLYADYALNINDTGSHPGRFANEVYFDGCDFDNLGYGIYANTDFQDFKVNNSVFNNILNSAIQAAAITQTSIVQGGFASSNNTFINVGLESGYVIDFQSGSLNCHSTAETFIDIPTGVLNVHDVGPSSFELSTINSANINNVVVSAKQGPILLPGNSTNASTGITINLDNLNSAFIDYTMSFATTAVGSVANPTFPITAVGSIQNPTSTPLDQIIINGTTVTLTGSTLSQAIIDINAAAIPGVTASNNSNYLQIVSANTAPLTIEGTAATSDFGFTISGIYNNTITVDGHMVTLTTTTLAGTINDINSADIPNIVATQDSGGHLVLVDTSGGTITTSGVGATMAGLPASTTPTVPSPVRIGRLYIFSQNGNVVMSETYSESSPSNITFNYSISGNTFTITYTSTAADTANWYIQSKAWLS